MTPRSITRGVQSLHRLQRIARVLSQHGFGHVVDRVNLGRFVPLWLRRERAAEAAPASVGRRLKMVAGELGPVFVKLGQMLATRPDILPPDILDELRTLQDRVEPFDSDEARRIIAEELQKPVAEAFGHVDEEPIASGSIGQVYYATLPDGRQVVIKVQRPRIEQEVRADVYLLEWLADALEKWVPEAHAYHPRAIVEEFARTLSNELDFTYEASVTARVRTALQDERQVIIPEVIWSHTTARVLTLQRVGGRNIDEALRADGVQFSRKQIASRLADVFLRQFFEIGVFHADPHPGNILVMPPAQIGLIDFGQTGVISETAASQLLVMVMGAVARDPELIVDALSEMRASSMKTDRAQLTRDIKALLDRYHGQPAQRLRVGAVFLEVTGMIRRHQLALPRDVVMMLKSMATIWGTVLRLDPDLNPAEILKPRLKHVIRERLSPPRLARAAGVTLWHLVSFLRSAPQQLREVLTQFSSGQWQVNVRHENIESLGREIDRSSNRLAFSIMIAAIVVASSMVVTSDSGAVLFGVRLQTYGFFGYLIAGVLGLGLLIAILRSGRLS
ncbi:MAG: phosphotransferase [Phycisphaerales bacterium]|nr:phosphotransferase [Phycisphaerales bacterium]